MHRSSRELAVKVTLDRTTKRITFASARNCTYELLRSKVNQGFSLSATSYSIQYTDDDGEVTEINSEEDLTEAILYFQAGTDDPPMSSAASILSGRSFGSRKITLRVEIIVDYEGRLSDTGSLVSMEEYHNRPQSEMSFSFGGSVIDEDDDSMTISSGHTGDSSRSGERVTSLYGSSVQSGGGRQSWQPKQSSALARSVETAEDLESIQERSMDGYHNPSSSTLYVNGQHDPVAVFERLKLHETASIAASSLGGYDLDGTDRGAAWLRDQNSRTIKSLLGQLPEPSISDGASQIAFEETNSLASSTGDLALQRDPQSGKYYYAYTSSGSASQSHEDENPSIAALKSLEKPRPSSMQMHWIAAHLVQPPENQPRTGSSNLQEKQPQQQYQPDPAPHPYYPHLDPDIPPEVLRFLTPGALTGPPHEMLTDCSVCGVLLDSMRYVCNTCGEKTPVTTIGNGGQQSGPSQSPPSDLTMAYPPLGHRTIEGSPTLSTRTFVGSGSSGSGSGGSGSGSGDSNGTTRRSKPLPSIPNSSSSSSSSSSSNSPTMPSPTGYFDTPSRGSPSSHSSSGSSATAQRPSENGYELCSGCLESAGVLHALEANMAPGSSPTTRKSPSEDARTLSVWRRTAPKTKGSLRHGYLEKAWGYTGWEVVEQEEEVKCSTCNTAIMKNRYQCASCQKFDLCQACYSQVHEVHPNHAFLVIPDKRERSRLEQMAIPSLPPDENDEQSLTHPGVKCAHCMLDIVGARFHCAFCDSIDICSNCESAGLPGNLDSSDGGHNSSHIMIKIPRPLESNEVDTASRRAMNLWTGRDAANVQRASKPSSVTSSYAKTVIGRPRHLEGNQDDHRMLCQGCSKPIVGIRYQCASCPSVPSSYSLCATCEERSYLKHDPMHIFFKLPRPVQRPVESTAPMLPNLYKTPVGPNSGSQNTGSPTDYLKTLINSSAICDRCIGRIQGVWYRCAFCGRDLCDVCEELDTHDDTHIFMVFKAVVDMTIFRGFTDVENPSTVIPYPIYR